MGLCFSSSLNRRQNSGSTGTDSKNVGKSQVLEIASGSIDGEGSSLRRPLPLPLPYPDGQILKWPNLKVFSFKELRSTTKDFRPETLVCELGFGSVYKGWLDEDTLTPTKAGSGMVVAIRRFNPQGYPGFQEWQLEVNFLGRLSHPNLVKLFGYCWDDDKILLVYEFMPKGNLDRLLFRRNLDIELLSWNTRLKIAIDAARGLAFLHTSETKVIFRAFKASNILLDGNYNAKISGFGLARLGPSGKNSHVSTNIVCTSGYSAPEYEATGHLNVK